MILEEPYLEAYRLYSKDFWGEHNLSPMTMWGFQEIVPDKEKKYYLNKAKLSLRIKKIKHIKENYENR